ncbi:bifunctional UDP-sugar hydrolase/5'-nucleotidase [Brevibacterium sp. ZH18]|uniref:bifunctional metallophosphatase/5'-nucleotidase n=1 Tax=Brevibacterium sp. ZH18 TaxID=2927784 RepID=UPI001F6054BD|nr:bifunctional UDP-sugar hydrolase/5'-nucleotidase [Brevibacterium sp. ZH18]MCI4011108.1 bifunctional metallophosphatase/5'-nucleotidase [Brevibacterium sp. ZH18]
MSTLVTKMLATGAAVSMLTLPGIAPVAAAPSLGGDSVKEAPSEAGTPAPSSTDSGSAAGKDAVGESEPKKSDSTEGKASAHAAVEGTKVQLLNITDFHGRLDEAGTQVASVVEEERANYAKQAGTAGTGFLSAGDNIGASTYVSSSQQDTPTLDVLNAIGVEASAVGNHEFDQGIDDLTGRVSDEADFPYLAANVYDKGTTNVVDGLDDYTTIDVGGVKIAVIGVVTKDTKSLVSPTGIADLEFGDPTDAVNRVAGEIEDLPVDQQPDMTVVEAHLGASNTDSLGEAEASNAEFKKLVTQADASVDVLFTGHTHLPYSFEAPVPGESDRTRPVLEAGSYGSVVGQVQLESDADGNWTTEKSELLSTKDKQFDSPVVNEVAKIIAEADEKAREVGSEVAGSITEDITRAEKDGKEDRGAESTLGNLVADALRDGVDDTQLEKADFGITNPGGLRTDLKCDDQYNEEDKCEVTVAELSGVLPFANDHGVVTMKGADVIGLFEEQWQPETASRPFLHLGISDDLDVVYDEDAKKGEHVESVKVHGKDIDPKKEYRVATLSFLAAGGDDFSSFAKGKFELSGLTDFETWENYFKKNTPVAPDKSERQVDAALDVIDGKKLKVDFKAPSGGIKPGETKDFVLSTDAKEKVDGPVDVSVDVPEGYTVNVAGSGQAASSKAAKSESAKSESAKSADAVIPEVEANAVATTLPPVSIPAGKSETRITITAPNNAHDKVTVTTSLQAGDAEWWDNNPLPVSHKYEATATVNDDANASGGDDGGSGSNGGSDSSGSADGSGSNGSADGGDASTSGSTSADADGSGADADGSGSDANGSKDGGDLPRTGFEALNIVAAALALIVAGGAAVAAVRRKKLDA